MQTGMYGFCVAHSEFHGYCYSGPPGLSKVVVAMSCAMMLLKQCYFLLWQLHLYFLVFK